MKKILLSLMVVLVLLILPCNPLFAAGNIEHRPVSFLLVHVNDTHSQFVPRNEQLTFQDVDLAASVPLGSVSRMATLVKQLREQKENILFLHAGDMVQGSLYYTLFKGKADADVYNAMGIDAMVTGNHEFDRGSEGLSILLDAARFPVLSANMDVSSDPALRGRIAPFVIKEIEGEPIGIIGLLVENIADISSPSKHTVMLPVIETAQNTIDKLTEMGVQIIILLTHIGYRNDLVLGASVTGADIIVGGHSHTLLGNFRDIGLKSRGEYPTIVTGTDNRDVLVVQAWEHTKLLGCLRVDVDETGRVAAFKGSPRIIAGTPFLDPDDNRLDHETLAIVTSAVEAHPGIGIYQNDPVIEKITHAYSRKVAELGNTIVGKALTMLTHTRIPDQAMPKGSQIAPIVCDSYLWKLNRTGSRVDISMVNAGGVRIDLPAGDITIETVYTLLPFQNSLTVFEMTGRQILAALEAAMTAIFDDNRSQGAFPYVSGLRYWADRNLAGGERITRCQVMGSSKTWLPIRESAVYRVVTNSFVAQGGDGYSTFQSLKGYDTGYIDTQVFLDYVAEKKIIVPVEQRVFCSNISMPENRQGLEDQTGIQKP